MLERRPILIFLLFLCIIDVGNLQLFGFSGSPKPPKEIITETTTIHPFKDYSQRASVKVFYETYCPFSVYFLQNQLYDVATSLSDYITLHLVPYGIAMTQYFRGKYTFKCQHGHKECYANKVHACALDVAANCAPTQVIKLIKCLTTTKYKKGEIRNCMIVHNLSYKSYEHCMKNKAEKLMNMQGETTKKNKNKISAVPVVEVNGFTNKTLRMNLKKELCKLLLEKNPPACVSFYN